VRRHPCARHRRHRPAADCLGRREEALKSAAGLLRTAPEEVEARLAALLDERRKLERDLAEAKKALALGGGGTSSASADEDIGGVAFSGQVLEGLDPKELRGLLDAAKQRMGSGVAAICAVNDGKASFAAAVTDDLTARFSAVDLVRAGVEALGGKGGGGRPDMAQGGGPDGTKAAEAIAAVRALLAAG
jgi:alanyl-tRNA synthetase